MNIHKNARLTPLGRERLVVAAPGGQTPEGVRGHWTVENSLHGEPGVSFRKDRARLRTGHGPANMAACAP